MSLGAPKPKWYNGESARIGGITYNPNTIEMQQWNVGVVDAGSYSRVEDPTTVDNLDFPCSFLIWNNRYDAVSNPSGNAVAVSDMTNVNLTTLSLVRDSNGDIDPTLSYLTGGNPGSLANAVAGKEQAIVQVIFFDGARNGGAGQWGSYASDGTTWQPSTWKEIGGNDRADVVSMSGVKGIISGAINSANLNTNKANFAKVKMRLYVKPTANAGRVEWVTRASYQYEG